MEEEKSYFKYVWIALGIVLVVGAFIIVGFSNNNNLLNQQNCATQSQKVLTETESQDGSGGPLASYNQTNHYNQNLNKCFVLVSYQSSAGDFVDLFDAYENNELAGSITVGNTQTYWIDHKSASQQEYQDFVNQRMDTNQ